MIVNVSAIITHKNKVLLIQRGLKDKHYPGHWGIPGGGMEDVDESLEATAIREAEEELRVHIIPDQILYNNRYKDVIFIVMTAHLADEKEFSKTLNISSEAHDYAWCSIAEIEEKNFTPFTKERIVEVLDNTYH